MISRLTTLTLGFAMSAMILAGLPAYSMAGQLITIASFNGSDGDDPFAGVTLDASGNIDGTTIVGGVNGGGTVFEINQGSNTINALGSFGAPNGTAPHYPGAVTLYNGNIYGIASGGASGDGVIYSLSQQGGSPTTLATFTSPTSSLPVAFDSQGNMYGTLRGGGNGDGSVWQIASGSHTITTFATFNGTNGAFYGSAVTLDASGNMYGTISAGGTNGTGTVWEIAHGSTTITTLASFDQATNDSASGVVVDSQGNIYGTTETDGTRGMGTVWEIVHGTNTIITLASFNGTNGELPTAGLTLDAAGNLYGETGGGGAFGQGALFEVAKGSGSITDLVSFAENGGGIPSGTVAIDSRGNLFGTTFDGGAYGNGTVWEYTASVPEPCSLITGLIGLATVGGFGLLRRLREES
jgi:uncharacterized repeat protein (TIGR03803 family)